MPPKKGRKRRARERRHGDGAEPRTEAGPSPPARREEPARPTATDLPKLRVRMAGFVLAVITMFIAIINVTSGLAEDSLAFLVTGVLLIALSLVLGVLSLVPERVRAFLSRK